MLLVTLRAANVPQRNLVGVRPHLNFVTAVAGLLGNQPSSGIRCDGSLSVSGIGIDWLNFCRRLNRSAIQSPMRLVAHFAVHAAVEHPGGHAPCPIEFAAWNGWIAALIVAMAAPAIVDREPMCLVACDGKVVAR
jgi:hypothetical protein